MDDPTAETVVLRAFDALFETLTVQRDAEAGVALFAGDADVVMWGSDEAEEAVGRAAIAELHRGIAASQADVTFRWDARHVHVEGDAAWVNAAGTVTIARPGGAVPRTGPYRLTAVFVRRDGTWRWHTFSGSEPATA